MAFLQQFLGEQGARFTVWIVVAIVLLIAVLFLWNMIRSALGDRLNLSDRADRRGRPPRLGITDSFAVDRQGRRLVIVRRDNVEHLIMIGGPNDLVVEAGFVRGERPAVPRADSRSAEPELIPALTSQDLQPLPASAPVPAPSVAPAPTAPVVPVAAARQSITDKFRAALPLAGQRTADAERSPEPPKPAAPIKAVEPALPPLAPPPPPAPRKPESTSTAPTTADGAAQVSAPAVPPAPPIPRPVPSPLTPARETVAALPPKPAAPAPEPAPVALVKAEPPPSAARQLAKELEAITGVSEKTVLPPRPAPAPVTPPPPKVATPAVTIDDLIPPVAAVAPLPAPPIPAPVVSTPPVPAPAVSSLPPPPVPAAKPAAAPATVAPVTAAPPVEPPAPKAAPAANPFDSLEEEMARLLGRSPGGKG